jgi:hypothetical protein
MNWNSVIDGLPPVSKKEPYVILFEDGFTAVLGRPWENTLGWEYVTHWAALPKLPPKRERQRIMDYNIKKYSNMKGKNLYE